MSTYKDFYWIFKEEYFHPCFSWDNYLLNEILISKNKVKKATKIIYQYSKDMKFLREWTYSELKNKKYNINVISKICNRKSKRYYANSIWCFQDDIFSLAYVSNFTSYNQGTEKRKRKIIQLDPITEKEIRTFCSIADACRFCRSKSHTNIIKAIKNNGHSCGFKWKYA